MSGTSIKYTNNISSGNDLIDGILWDTRWRGTVTYAFPSSESSYGYTDYTKDAFRPVTAAQQEAAKFILDTAYGTSAGDGFSVEGFTKLTISQGSQNTATIRYAESGLPPTAETILPYNSNSAGDVWFGNHYAYRAPKAGNYAWQTMLHETGHALGLKHPHDQDGEFGTLPWRYDTVEYTVMSYRSYVGASLDGYTFEDYGAPQSFMALDIQALQYLYGADYTTNSGNTVYRWEPGSGTTYVNGKATIVPGANRIFATIWDGGGNDSFDLRHYATNMIVDLQPGEYSSFSGRQTADLGHHRMARGNIFNAFLYKDNPASLIENVWAGSGNDQITGNQVANSLWGYAGNDRLSGLSGNDRLAGGAGHDILIGGDGSDRFLFDTKLSSSNVDNIYDFEVGSDKIALENAVFTAFSSAKTLLDTCFYVAAGTSPAQDLDDYIIYQFDTGKLLYDADGSGSKYKATPFAILQAGLSLTASDFMIV